VVTSTTRTRQLHPRRGLASEGRDASAKSSRPDPPWPVGNLLPSPTNTHLQIQQEVAPKLERTKRPERRFRSIRRPREALLHQRRAIRSGTTVAKLPLDQQRKHLSSWCYAVETMGIEPTTFCLQSNRTTARFSLAIGRTLGQRASQLAPPTPLATVVCPCYWHANGTGNPQREAPSDRHRTFVARPRHLLIALFSIDID